MPTSSTSAVSSRRAGADVGTEITRLVPFIRMAPRCLPGPADQCRHPAPQVAKAACAAEADPNGDTWGGVDPARWPRFGAGPWCVRTGGALPRDPRRVSAVRLPAV